MTGSVDCGLDADSLVVGVVEQRQRQLLGQAAHLPQRLAAIESERAEGIGRGEALEAWRGRPAPPPQLPHIAKFYLPLARMSCPRRRGSE